MTEYVDLVKRLRDATIDYDGSHMNNEKIPWRIYCEDMREAADAIERLEKELENLRTTSIHLSNVNAMNQGNYATGFKRGAEKMRDYIASETHEAAMIFPDADHSTDAGQAIEDALRSLETRISALTTEDLT